VVQPWAEANRKAALDAGWVAAWGADQDEDHGTAEEVAEAAAEGEGSSNAVGSD